MSESSPRSLTPAERVDDVPTIMRALRSAVRDALLRHKRDGLPVAVWRDGQVVWIPPEEIPVTDEEAESAPDSLRHETQR